MRYLLAIVAVAAIVGCSSSTPKAPAFTPDQMKPALLTVEDLGGTWKVNASASATASPTATPSVTPTATATPTATGCEYLDRLISKKPGDPALGSATSDNPAAKAAFQVEMFGPFIGHEVTAPGDDAAKKTLSGLNALATKCKTFHSVDANGTATDFAVAPIELKKAGDDTVGVQVSAASPPTILGSINVQISIITVRRGGLVSQISWVGLNSKPDIGFLQKLADTSAEKLKAVK